MARMIPGFANVAAIVARVPRWRWLPSAGMSLLLHVSLLVLVLIMRAPPPRDFPPTAIPVTLTTVAMMPAAPSASALASLAPSAAQPDPQLVMLRAEMQPFLPIPNLAQSIAPTPAVQTQGEALPPRKPTPPRPIPRQPVPTVQSTPSKPTPPPVQQAAVQAPAHAVARTIASASTADLPQQSTEGRGRVEEGPGLSDVHNASLESPGDAYFEQVRRWVARFKKYPDAAIKREQEGTVALAFKVARDGTILDAWIDKSSGYPLLDQAALDMIYAASPIAKMPDHYAADTLTLVMNENFTLDLLDRLFH